MKAHVKGTGPMVYPDQDPADLRARAVDEQFDAIRREFRRYIVILERYHAQVRNPAINGRPDYKVVSDARYRMDRAIIVSQHVVKDALEAAEVKVIHDRTEAP